MTPAEVSGVSIHNKVLLSISGVGHGVIEVLVLLWKRFEVLGKECTYAYDES